MVPLISLQKISKYVPGKTLFSELSMVVNEGQRVALIGPNGAGKSTLLKIFAGSEEIEDGTVSARRGLRCSYVPQADNVTSGTVYSVLSELVSQDEDDRESQIAICMGEVGFENKDQKVSELSGGWRKRLSIACGLIQKPELFLLDEPTNHLDIESIEWLEELITGYKGTVVFVSHDRYFIESVANRVIEIEKRYPNGYYAVDGGYSDFIAGRAIYLEQMQSYQESLSNRVRREVEWLRQGAKARTTKSKHRTKEALKMVDELKSLDFVQRRANLEFAEGGKRSKELIKVEEIAKSLSGKQLFSNLSLVVSPGSRIGIVGPNGSGKTTLLRVLLGELPPDKGRVVRSNRLQVAYFDQVRKSLEPEMTLSEALCGDAKSVVFGGREYVAQAWAARFLFRYEQLNLPISRLSGGEQARVLLARVMREPADVLVLDEPTNDLDIQTLEVLEEAFEEFPGAILLVTHDRYLLDRVARSVIGISPGEESAIFASYLQWEISREEKKEAAPKRESKSEVSTKAPKGGLTYAERLELEGIDKKIAKAEKEVSRCEAELAIPENASDTQKLTRLCADLAAAQESVERLFARWEELEAKRG